MDVSSRSISYMEQAVVDFLITGQIEYEPFVLQLQNLAVLKTAAAGEHFFRGGVSETVARKIDQRDPSFLGKLIEIPSPSIKEWRKQGLSCLYKAREDLFGEDPEVMCERVARDGRAFMSASEAMRNRSDVARIAVANCREMGDCLGPALRKKAILAKAQQCFEDPLVHSRRAMLSCLLGGTRYTTLVGQILGLSALKTAAVRAYYEEGCVREGLLRTWLEGRDREFLEKLDGLSDTSPEKRLITLLGLHAFYDDRDVVRFAVAQEGRLLACASSWLQEDEELVGIAVEQDSNALRFIR